MLMKKLSEDHYIICDDSEIKQGDWVVGCTRTVVQCMYPENVHHRDVKKITHSTQPLDCACSNRGYKLNTNCAERNRCFDKVQYLPLQEVKELLGIVNAEMRTRQFVKSINATDEEMTAYYCGYRNALEDNKEKKYTEEDLRKAISETRRGMLFLDKYVNEFIQSLQPKTEWEVEIIDGKLKLNS